MYRLTRAVTSSAMPASRRGTESSAPVTGHPAAVRWGAFAAYAVIADQVAPPSRLRQDAAWQGTPARLSPGGGLTQCQVEEER
jgi:hypothetical protein